MQNLKKWVIEGSIPEVIKCLKTLEAKKGYRIAVAIEAGKKEEDFRATLASDNGSPHIKSFDQTINQNNTSFIPKKSSEKRSAVQRSSQKTKSCFSSASQKEPPGPIVYELEYLLQETLLLIELERKRKAGLIRKGGRYE